MTHMTRYFMVTVAETVEFSYPVAADDGEDARERVSSLLASCKVPTPLGVATTPSSGRVEVREEPVESEPLPCSQVAAQSFTARQRVLLLGDAGTRVRSDIATPQEVSHAAKAVLKRTGSGELTPSRRKRR